MQIDADLSHDPADLPALLANIEHGADLAIGSRYVPGGRTRELVVAAALALAVGEPLRRRPARPRRQRRHRRLPRPTGPGRWSRCDFDDVTAEGYGFQIEMTHRLVRAGGRIVEFPIEFRDRRAGESKLSQGIVNEALGLVLRLWVADRRDRRTRRRRSG